MILIRSVLVTFTLLKRKIIFSCRKTRTSWRSSRWSYGTSRENWPSFGIKLKPCKAPYCLGLSTFSPTTRNKNVSFSAPQKFSFRVETCVFMCRAVGSLDTWQLRGQTGKNTGRKPESPAAVAGAAEPAAEPQPHLGPQQPSGQAASWGDEENSTTK